MIQKLRPGSTRRSFVASAPLLAALGACAAHPSGQSLALGAAGADRPDIIMIVLDDVGFSDLGAFGSEIRTPNMDALAAGGLRYNRFDTRAVCTATRAALLTGRNNQTVGLADLPAETPQGPENQTKDRGELPSNAPLVSETLHAAGYATYAVGKWHVAPEYEDGSPGKNGSWPLQRGFDRYYGFPSGWTDQYHPTLLEGNAQIATPQREGYHLSADLVDRTIADLRSTPENKPAFVYLAFGAAHSPIQAPRAYIDRYAGQYDRGWDVMRAERLTRMKALGVVPQDTHLTAHNNGDRLWADLSDTEKRVYARFMETYAGFIEHTDDQIGRLVADLKARGRFDNTLIVLVSDNGAAGEGGQKGYFEKLYQPSSMTIDDIAARLDDLGTDKTQSQYQRPWARLGTTPFNRYKVWPYAGGVRTPMILSWPAGADAGAVRDQYVDVIDLAPTFVDVAGARYETEVKGQPVIPVAGRSLRASLRNPRAPSPREVQYFELRGNRAIRQGDWRAVAMHQIGTDFDNDRWELFNLAADFSESVDLSARYPEKLSELKALWWSEARRYANPPISEPPERFARRNSYSDAFPASSQASGPAAGR